MRERSPGPRSEAALKPFLRALSLLGLALVPVVHAAPNPAGVDLRWSNCIADGGTGNRSFACNANAGVDVLVCSYQTDAPIVNVNGAELTVDIRVDASALPLWWQFKNTGTCRNTALAMNLVANPAWVNCVDQWGGQAAGGIGLYGIGFLAANMARIRAAAAVPLSALFDVFPGNEYFVANFTISHTKTVGTGACSGCTTRACILFAKLVVTTSGGAGDRTFTQPKDGNVSHWVGWQGGVASNPQIVCDADGCNYQFGCIVPPVATRAASWGALKDLYR